MKTPFIWLGSGRASKRGVGRAGRFLDTAARAGLPVPPGGILLDEFYWLALEHELAVVRNGRLTIDDPDFLYNTLYEGVRFPRLDGPIRVASLFSLPEAATVAVPAAQQEDINPEDGAALTAAFSAVWQVAISADDTLRRDMLLQQQIDVQLGGTAVTEPHYHADLITVAGDRPNAGPLDLPRLDMGGDSAGLPDWQRRLQKLLRGLRRTLGEASWQVTWGDDGEVCWLLGVDTLREPALRNDRLTRVVLGDLVPELPSPFLASLLAEAGRRYAERCHAVDPVLPPAAEFVVVVAQRPWFNQTLIDTARRRLEREEPGRGSGPVGLRWLRMLFGRRTAAPAGAEPPPLSQPEPAAATFTQVIDACVAQLLSVIDDTLQLTRGGAAAPRPDVETIRPVYDSLRGQLLALADTAVMVNQLPSPESLWLLSADEARALDAGVSYSAEFFAGRTAVLRRLRSVTLSHELRRFDALAAAEDALPVQPEPTFLQGDGLLEGLVSGQAWVLEQPGSDLPPGFVPFETVLVAPTLDADWIPTLSLVAGVVLEGGDAAAAVLRGVGLPAVINVPDVTRAISSGRRVRLDGGSGRVWLN